MRDAVVLVCCRQAGCTQGDDSSAPTAGFFASKIQRLTLTVCTDCVVVSGLRKRHERAQTSHVHVWDRLCEAAEHHEA